MVRAEWNGYSKGTEVGVVTQTFNLSILGVVTHALSEAEVGRLQHSLSSS